MENINLKKLSEEELKELIAAASKELSNRKSFVHYRVGSSVKWAKVVTAIDPHKLNGYGLLGDFLSTRKRDNLVPENSLIVEASRRQLTLLRATSDDDYIIIAKVDDDQYYAVFELISLELYGHELQTQANSELIDG